MTTATSVSATSAVTWPARWRKVPLWAIFERIKDVGHPDEEMLSVYRDHGVVRKDSRDDNMNKTAENRNIYQLVDCGWLVVNRMKAWQGSVGISKYRGIVSGHYICFRPRHHENSRFLNYLLRSKPYILEYQRLSRGVRPNQIEIDNDELRSVTVRLPPLEEQRRIADFLDARSAALAHAESSLPRLREMLMERRWSLFQDLVDHTAAPVGPLRRIMHTITDGPFGSAFSSSDYSDDGAAVVRLGNIGFAEYRSQDQARIPMALYRKFLRHKVDPGSVLIAGLGDARNHAGRACVAPDLGPAIVKGKSFCARIDRAVADPEFIALLLSSPIGRDSMESRGSTRAMINLELVKSALLPLPPLAEQKRIAGAMKAADELGRKVERGLTRQCELLAERRQALITAAVTGQIDVTTARGVG